jgi:hypothetical protein
MPKFTVGQRIRVVPNTADPRAYPNRNRHGYIRSVHGTPPAAEGAISTMVFYDVLLDGNLFQNEEVVTLPEHTLEPGPR